MPIGWRDAAKIYWPYLALLAFNACVGFYAYAYANGQRSILNAASIAAQEAKHG